MNDPHLLNEGALPALSCAEQQQFELSAGVLLVLLDPPLDLRVYPVLLLLLRRKAAARHPAQLQQQVCQRGTGTWLLPPPPTESSSYTVKTKSRSPSPENSCACRTALTPAGISPRSQRRVFSNPPPDPAQKSQQPPLVRSEGSEAGWREESSFLVRCGGGGLPAQVCGAAPPAGSWRDGGRTALTGSSGV